MSLTFGFYLAIVGVSIVFATILAIALASEAIQIIFRPREKQVQEENLMRVAAIAATYCYMGSETAYSPRRMVSEGGGRWSAVARVEALDAGAEHR